MRRGYSFVTLTVLIAALSGPSHAQSCIRPLTPIAPTDPATISEYADIIRDEFETYFSRIGRYIACLDAERSSALGEARDLTETYQLLLSTTRTNRMRN
ncbi:MAG: hypothetical protein IBX58_15580 [Roseovarius sp.]|nr:hypothetical protein [Roseovarius sp.]